MLQKRICCRQICFDCAAFLCTNGIDIYRNTMILQRFFTVVEQGKQFIFPKISLVFHQNIQIRILMLIAFASAAIHCNLFQHDRYVISSANLLQIRANGFCDLHRTIIFRCRLHFQYWLGKQRKLLCVFRNCFHFCFFFRNRIDNICALVYNDVRVKAFQALGQR